MDSTDRRSLSVEALKLLIVSQAGNALALPASLRGNGSGVTSRSTRDKVDRADAPPGLPESAAPRHVGDSDAQEEGGLEGGMKRSFPLIDLVVTTVNLLRHLRQLCHI